MTCNEPVTIKIDDHVMYSDQNVNGQAGNNKSVAMETIERGSPNAYETDL
jgi:hypothetical protein